jgi:hypothetical protein
VGVAVLSETRAALDELLGGFPRLVGRLDGPVVSSVRGAGPLRQCSRHRVAGRVLLVGDAAGHVDAVVRGRPEAYDAAWRRLGWRHQLLTKSLRTTSRHRALRRRVVPAAAARPRGFGAAVDQLARPA